MNIPEQCKSCSVYLLTDREYESLDCNCPYASMLGLEEEEDCE